MRRTILVPLDGSHGGETVLAEAAGLARARHAGLRLLYVAPRPRVLAADGEIVRYADQEAGRLTQDALAYLVTAASTLGDLEVETVVRFGDPAQQILEAARMPDVAMIAMATHRRSGLARLVHGSVAARVDQESPLPLILVDHGDAERPVVRLRRFWCAEHRREVEVEFEMRGLPGFRSPVAVRSCSAFEPGAAIDCSRRCLDPSFRLQWEPVAPGAGPLRPPSLGEG
jgi:universal stress protein A